MGRWLLRQWLVVLTVLFTATFTITLFASSAPVKAKPKPTPKPKLCHYVKRYDAKTQTHYIQKRCEPSTFRGKVQAAVATLAPTGKSALRDRFEREIKVAKNSFGLGFYEPTYVLPVYNTFSPSPFYANNPGNTPNNIPIKSTEFKAQFSLLVPLWVNMFHSYWSLNASYTQLMYWQLYSKQPFFRETNYEPRLFVNYYQNANWLLSAGIDHQSNGRGGTGPREMERSWNRAFIDVMFSGPHWLLIVEPWVPIFSADSSDLHNRFITRYLGYGRVIIAVKFYHQELSLMLRNWLESGFKRGAVELDYSFPLAGHVQGFVQLFSGYGQSLIEYDHATTSIGIGVALNNWI